MNPFPQPKAGSATAPHDEQGLWPVQHGVKTQLALPSQSCFAHTSMLFGLLEHGPAAAPGCVHWQVGAHGAPQSPPPTCQPYVAVTMAISAVPAQLSVANFISAGATMFAVLSSAVASRGNTNSTGIADPIIAR